MKNKIGIEYGLRKNGSTWEVTADGERVSYFFTRAEAEAFMRGIYYQAERLADGLTS